MNQRFPSPLVAASLLAAVVLGGCQRHDAPGADSVGSTGSTVRAAPSQDAASTPLPVAPGGLTNASTAAQGSDLTNSTRATGSSNTYQPPSADNPAPGGAASAPMSGASRQSVSSTTTGTQPMPSDGTSPTGTSSGAPR